MSWEECNACKKAVSILHGRHSSFTNVHRHLQEKLLWNEKEKWKPKNKDREIMAKELIRAGSVQEPVLWKQQLGGEWWPWTCAHVCFSQQTLCCCCECCCYNTWMSVKQQAITIMLQRARREVCVCVWGDVHSCGFLVRHWSIALNPAAGSQKMDS